MTKTNAKTKLHFLVRDLAKDVPMNLIHQTLNFYEIKDKVPNLKPSSFKALDLWQMGMLAQALINLKVNKQVPMLSIEYVMAKLVKLNPEIRDARYTNPNIYDEVREWYQELKGNQKQPKKQVDNKDQIKDTLLAYLEKQLLRSNTELDTKKRAHILNVTNQIDIPFQNISDPRYKGTVTYTLSEEEYN